MSLHKLPALWILCLLHQASSSTCTSWKVTGVWGAALERTALGRCLVAWWDWREEGSGPENDKGHKWNNHCKWYKVVGKCFVSYETSRAPHLTREISRGFPETGKLEKVAQRICFGYTEGVLVLSEIMLVSETTFVHVLVCSWPPSLSSLVMPRWRGDAWDIQIWHWKWVKGSVTSSSNEEIAHLYLIFRLEPTKVDIWTLQNPRG